MQIALVSSCLFFPYLHMSDLTLYYRKPKKKKPKEKPKARCHVCGFIQSKTDLEHKHYPRQHPGIPVKPLLENDKTTKLLEPNFVPKQRYAFKAKNDGYSEKRRSNKQLGETRSQLNPEFSSSDL